MMKSELDRDSGHNIHNNLFVKTFSDPENVKIFLKLALPEPIRNAIDYSKIKIDFTTYVSDDIRDYYSDIVVKTRLKSGDQKELDSDIYVLVEHKSTSKKKILVQMLKYMYFEWQKDADMKKTLRVIIPMVFYHGRSKWKVPRTFVDQFKVNDEIKEFLLNYRYVFFDTSDWNFLEKANQDLRDNVFLLTSLVLMKSAFNKDMENINAIFRLWYEKGFIKEKNQIIFFLCYISYIRDISLEELKKSLEESNIKGGDLMPSLAQRLIEQGIEQGIEKGLEKGEKKNARDVARRMLSDDFPIDTIVKYTGLTEQEVKELMN